MDFPGRVLAAMIAIILITIFPLQYLAQIFNENTDACIDDGTRQLVDDIKIRDIWTSQCMRNLSRT
jgi:hypothetical protein